MKKQLFLSFIALVAAAGSIMAQDIQQKKPNEKAKETYFKLKTDLALVGEQDGKVFNVFETFYTDQQKAMDEMRAAGTRDREQMKATREKLSAERDAKLKGILTEEQMKKWLTEIEPGMQTQRRNVAPSK